MGSVVEENKCTGLIVVEEKMQKEEEGSGRRRRRSSGWLILGSDRVITHKMGSHHTFTLAPTMWRINCIHHNLFMLADLAFGLETWNNTINGWMWLSQGPLTSVKSYTLGREREKWKHNGRMWTAATCAASKMQSAWFRKLLRGAGRGLNGW